MIGSNPTVGKVAEGKRDAADARSHYGGAQTAPRRSATAGHLTVTRTDAPVYWPSRACLNRLATVGVIQ